MSSRFRRHALRLPDTALTNRESAVLLPSKAVAKMTIPDKGFRALVADVAEINVVKTETLRHSQNAKSCSSN
jgi:hypothetical protein